MPLTFEIKKRCEDCDARVGRITTPHGAFDTPAFMPVGTQGAIKGILPDMVASLGAGIILGNTYHLMLRPGSALVARMGGLHQWMRWPRPILTDSGGYQVFSLSNINRVSNEGVTFQSHLDGTRIELTPRRAIEVQNELGADIIMALDDCPPAAAGVESRVAGRGSRVEQCDVPRTRDSRLEPRDLAQRIRESCERSVRWLEQCIEAHHRSDQSLFGIVQGGTDLERRSWCVERICGHDLPGYAIGGVAVGEGFEGLKRVVEHTTPLLPANRPRYLMGVGYERDILTAVRAGVDMFDCVLPTRNGRNASAFTPTGRIRLRNAAFAHDPSPIDPDCDCPACRGGYSRSYLRHLFLADEMLGPILVSAHNLRHFQRFLLDIRRTISDNDFPSLTRRWPVATTGDTTAES